MNRGQKTTVDYFAVRTQALPPVALEGFRPLFGALGPNLKLERSGRGKYGFQQGAEMTLGGLRVGRMDFGGDAMRGWLRVQLEGTGCGWVQDWDAVDSVERLPAAEIRRVDPALTTWEGEVSHARVVEAHAAGRFTTGGRPPNMRLEVNSEPGKGNTVYIGDRTADKFGRFYEKGFEMIAKFPESMREGATVDGHPVEGIYRSEIEFKAATRPLPWEIIERRDQYFAGAYPFCADILPGVEVDILAGRPEREAQRDLAAALANCRQTYGNILFTALHAYEGDIGAVWERIVGDKHAPQLVSAGVLLVDHYDGGAAS